MNEVDSGSDNDGSHDHPIDEVVNLDELEPEKTFNILGNETRLSILRALWNAPEEPVSFTDLRQDPNLETHNLDYHIDKLVGHFVNRNEDGYSLQHAGEQVMRAMLSGVFTQTPTLSPEEINHRCPFCGDAVTLRYEAEALTARCTSCGGVTSEGFPEGTFVSYGFPPAGLENRSREEIYDAAHVLYDSKITPMMNGVCPECASTVGHSFDICENHTLGTDGLCTSCGTRFEVWTEYRCEHCDYNRKCALWFKVLLEPAVIHFYHEEAGLTEMIPFSKLTWRNASYISDISVTVLSQEPLRFEVNISLENARLTVKLDDELESTSIERAKPLETDVGT